MWEGSGYLASELNKLKPSGALDVPHREQAHSYNWIEHNLKKQVGCQAAFASRLAHRKAKAKDRSLRQLLHNERKLEYRF